MGCPGKWKHGLTPCGPIPGCFILTTIPLLFFLFRRFSSRDAQKARNIDTRGPMARRPTPRLLGDAAVELLAHSNSFDDFGFGNPWLGGVEAKVQVGLRSGSQSTNILVPSMSILNPGIRIFLENLRKPRENARSWERTMVEKNGNGINP